MEKEFAILYRFRASFFGYLSFPSHSEEAAARKTGGSLYVPMAGGRSDAAID